MKLIIIIGITILVIIDSASAISNLEQNEKLIRKRRSFGGGLGGLGGGLGGLGGGLGGLGGGGGLGDITSKLGGLLGGGGGGIGNIGGAVGGPGGGAGLGNIFGLLQSKLGGLGGGLGGIGGGGGGGGGGGISRAAAIEEHSEIASANNHGVGHSPPIKTIYVIHSYNGNSGGNGHHGTDYTQTNAIGGGYQTGHHGW
ncbi:uncharacterized protein LOC129613722 [Condylostylus longicornis]|uniref:uncharacterized protein LOC129613722 n=1 Tax=Condylostylus longicornis TaxID=2530218 RepID=UPI00244E1224|nr:uncharacterized protein LOC129613722 [Condylostylus longicornis]